MAIELFGVDRQADQDADGQELVRRVAVGDRDAVAEIYDRYAPGLYRLITAILGATSDAEDALQNVFVMLAEGRANRARNLRAYLFQSARREALQMLRRRRREAPLPVTDCAGTSDQTDRVDWQQLLSVLPVDQREVIAMKVYEQMTFEEIAAIVGGSANTAASRYRYGIARLRSALGGEDSHGEI